VQKIIIKNFGPVKDAEIEIKKTLILIGEQASGKSTIAKLIYFFRTLPEELKIHLLSKFVYPYLDEKKICKIKFDFEDDIIKTIKQKFNDCFSHIYNSSHFKIEYFYKNPDKSDSTYILLEVNENKGLTAKFDSDSREHLGKKLSQALTRINPLVPEFDFNNILKSHLLGIETIGRKNNLFIIAGRNATVSYSRTFEKQLFADLSNSIDQSKSYDETLMLKFINRVDEIKNEFEAYNFIEKKSFENIFDNLKSHNNEEENFIFKTFLENSNLILKGSYELANDSESIKLNGLKEKYVLLKNASTGQQEVIRILQDLFLALGQQNFFRVIEEPEAHLFPEAQKLLVEIFACFVNYHKEYAEGKEEYQDNKLIITTHSPYILTAYNNLLFANRVIQKNPDLEKEVYKHVNKDCILDSDNFSAYSLKIVQNEDDEYYQNIVNPKTGLISQNFLDSVSDTLNSEFHNLYDLYTKSFAR